MTMNRLAKNVHAALSRAEGFTLIELLVTMVIALVILAGLYSNFIMQSRVQASQASTVDAVEDLRLASHIMADQLRLASNLCWDATNSRLVYQPLGAATMASCTTLDPSWGAFSFDSSASTGGRLWWIQPNPGAASPSPKQEMLRGLDPTNGFSVTGGGVSNALRTVTLISQYKNIDRQNKNLQLRFDVKPRNE